MKQTLKRIVTQPIWHFARDTYDAVRRIPELPGAYLHSWRRESIRRLAELKDVHRGKRAFIIGNGPSLKQTDLSKFKNEVTFAMNRFYLAFPELGFTTSYICVTNDLVVEQFADDLAALPIPKFIAWRSHKHFSPQLPITQLPTFVYTSYTPKFLSTSARWWNRAKSSALWEGQAG